MLNAATQGLKRQLRLLERSFTSQRKRKALLARERSTLREVFPNPAETAAALQRLEDEYRDDHRDYIENISSPRAAMSLRQVALLAHLVRLRGERLKRVADLGSGFSSYVLARESQRQGFAHFAVDDHEGWLDKTRAFAERRGLALDGLMTWDAFRGADGPRNLDFIFHDLGNTTTRILALPVIEECAAEGAWLLVDDMHKPHYAPHAIGFLKPRWHLSSLVEFTLDDYGRYAYLARRQEQPR